MTGNPSTACKALEDRICDDVLVRLAVSSPWAAYILLAALEVETGAEQHKLVQSLTLEQARRADAIINATVVEVFKFYGWRTQCQA